MTVRTINHETIREGQQAWLEAEYDARAAYADLRLDTLDRIGPQITDADRFDAAYAIWDDYIDGRRHDDLFEPLSTARLSEQAGIFTRISRYLPSHELVSLAEAAWGEATFEVFTRQMGSGALTGKLGWYRGATLMIVTASDGPVGREKVALTIWKQRCGHVVTEVRPRGGRLLALHPVFGRAI